jgi:hypothetical protein
VSAAAVARAPGRRLRPAEALALQRSIGNAAVAKLARAQTASNSEILARDRDDSGPYIPSFKLGDTTMHGHTFAEVAAQLNWGEVILKQERDEAGIDDDSELGKKLAADIQNLENWKAFFAKGGDRALTDDDVEMWSTQVGGVVSDTNADVDSIHRVERQRFWDAAKDAFDKAEAADRSLKAALPKMQDAARKAFKDGQTSQLDSVMDMLGTIGTQLDNGLAIKDLVKNGLSQAAGETLAANFAKLAKAAGKVSEGLVWLDKGLALVGAIQTIAADKQTTTLGAGAEGINTAVSLFSAAGTITGLASPSLTLMTNMYLIPLTQACVKGIHKIEDLLHEQNKDWVEAFGEPGNYNVEQGGKPMWDYMQRVMTASGAGNVPLPTGAVEQFFLDYRSRFNTGVGAKSSLSELPYDFHLFGSNNVTAGKFQSWIWRNRRKVWYMLYGSMKMPG